MGLFRWQNVMLGECVLKPNIFEIYSKQRHFEDTILITRRINIYQCLGMFYYIFEESKIS